MLRSRLHRLSSVMMDFVNLRAVQGQRSCRNLVSVTSFMDHSPALLAYYRSKMHYKDQRKNKWKFSITKKMVS